MSRPLAPLLLSCLLAASASFGCHPAGPDAEPAATPPAKPAASGERKIAYWVAPMDPTFISDKPGKSPMGMDLVPVYEDEAGEKGAPGTVRIDPVVLQNIGVRTAPVSRQTIVAEVRTLGEVDVAESEVSVVNLRYSGWVEKLRVERTGDPVRRGQVLFDVYSPELVAAEEELLLAIRGQGAGSDLARSSRRKLELWNVSASDIDAVVAAGQSSRTLPVRSPAAGFVLHKAVVEGARVSAGADLFRIGNLASIWVTAQVYEYDAPFIQVGQTARMSLTYQGDTELQGRVDYVYPTLDSKSRTLRVRLEFPNPGLQLKPGMFATVWLQARQKADVLVVPTEAIIHDGKRELVFVALGGGRFSPRTVTTGIEGDAHVTEILEGLAENEVVVTSAQFLLDSESQLHEAIQKLLSDRDAAGADGAQK